MNECSYSGWLLASHSCCLGPAGPVRITSSDLSSSDMLYTIKARGSFKTWCPREPASPWQGGGWQQVCKGSGELRPFLFLSVAYSHCWWVKTQIRKHHMILVLCVELAFGSLAPLVLPSLQQGKAPTSSSLSDSPCPTPATSQALSPSQSVSGRNCSSSSDERDFKPCLLIVLPLFFSTLRINPIHCVMNWEIGIDIYTLICIKWITNKNLLYKK